MTMEDVPRLLLGLLATVMVAVGIAWWRGPVGLLIYGLLLQVVALVSGVGRDRDG